MSQMELEIAKERTKQLELILEIEKLKRRKVDVRDEEGKELKVVTKKMKGKDATLVKDLKMIAADKFNIPLDQVRLLVVDEDVVELE
jgi:hypothetical protein